MHLSSVSPSKPKKQMYISNRLNDSFDRKAPLSQRRMMATSQPLSHHNKYLQLPPVQSGCQLCQVNETNQILLKPCRCDDRLYHIECLHSEVRKTREIDTLYCDRCQTFFPVYAMTKYNFRNKMALPALWWFILMVSLIIQLVFAGLNRNDHRTVIIIVITMIVNVMAMGYVLQFTLDRARLVYWKVVQFEPTTDHELNLHHIRQVLLAMRRGNALVITEQATLDQ